MIHLLVGQSVDPPVELRCFTFNDFWAYILAIYKERYSLSAAGAGSLEKKC